MRYDFDTSFFMKERNISMKWVLTNSKVQINIKKKPLRDCVSKSRYCLCYEVSPTLSPPSTCGTEVLDGNWLCGMLYINTYYRKEMTCNSYTVKNPPKCWTGSTSGTPPKKRQSFTGDIKSLSCKQSSCHHVFVKNDEL